MKTLLVVLAVLLIPVALELNSAGPEMRRAEVHMVDGTIKEFEADRLTVEPRVVHFWKDEQLAWSFSTRHTVFVRFSLTD